jgi:hypothetical protein
MSRSAWNPVISGPREHLEALGLSTGTLSGYRDRVAPQVAGCTVGLASQQMSTAARMPRQSGQLCQADVSGLPAHSMSLWRTWVRCRHPPLPAVSLSRQRTHFQREFNQQSPARSLPSTALSRTMPRHSLQLLDHRAYAAVRFFHRRSGRVCGLCWG